MTMTPELATADPAALPKQYDPASIEGPIYRRWLAAGAFRAIPDAAREPYVIMMPLPNVTGALHMGHAMDNVMQDLLIRWHRMRGDRALWMPGTDHAGIATQAVVEKRLLELEELTRHDLGREGLVARIWEWKDQYQKRIVDQQQAMGCSCDWERGRFTMDAVCSRAVRWTFFNLFRDGLIYRGTRLVNWDCYLQTAVSDDEIVHETIDGFFWHLRYPVIDPQPGEPTHITVATTRPETMLGDTAVACHPDPAGVLDAQIAEARARLAAAPARDRGAIEATLAELEARRETHLPRLLQFVEMAKAGRRVMLPLVDRPIPIILDTWAKPALGSGCVKITPGHDPNDYQVWQRHKGEIDIINILNPDGTLNANAGRFAGLDRFEAREQVEVHLRARGLLEHKEARQIEIGHSDRSKTPIEPYFSLQWFVQMGDVPDGIICGRGTPNEFTAPGLAQAAIDAASGDWRSPTGRSVAFHPDAERYASTYLNWLGEKRDWCISRQLWWGHRIPIWAGRFAGAELDHVLALLRPLHSRGDVHARVNRRDGTSIALTDGATSADVVAFAGDSDGAEILICLRDAVAEADLGEALEGAGVARDPDVLDTWFSSGIWPHSTLGWPDPTTAPIDHGQLPLGPEDGRPDALAYFYPGSCLVTGRDIITLWVVRMVLMGLYNLGDVPFTDVFIHANILDGKGERMSKSKGNGIDPVDIIERYGADAMRYVLCEMQTGTQDVRLPVQAISPYSGEPIDLAEAKHGRSIFTYLDPKSGREFDVLGTMPDVPSAKLISDRFLAGRNFCNKLWNALRFALMHLEGGTGAPGDAADHGAEGEHEHGGLVSRLHGLAGHSHRPSDHDHHPATEDAFKPLHITDLAPEDTWILSRLAGTVAEVDRQLGAYNPAAAIGAARDFFWSDLCDWYLELIKPRLSAEAGSGARPTASSAHPAGPSAHQTGSGVHPTDRHTARQVLAAVLDQALRLLHPFVPFITEALWERLCERAPERGIGKHLSTSEHLILAEWPDLGSAWHDDDLEARFAFAQEAVRAVRDLRNQYNVAPSRKLAVTIRATGASAAALASLEHVLLHGAGLASLAIDPEAARAPDAASAAVRDVEIFVAGVVDLAKERERLAKQQVELAGRIDGIRKRLANEAFVTRAKPEVVERERAALTELEAQAEHVARSLAGVGGEVS